MGYKGLIKKFAKFILVSQAHDVVNIKLTKSIMGEYWLIRKLL